MRGSQAINSYDACFRLVLTETNFDYSTDGVTFVPGDYVVVDLATGATTEMANVQSAATFNTDEYKTTKMAFRKIPAGSFKSRTTAEKYDEAKGASQLVNNDVTFTEDYYMAVFPVTVAQYAKIADGTDSADTTPMVSKSWNEFRGSMGGNVHGQAPSAPTNTSLVGILNGKLAGGDFEADLPSSFQWERAVRAGTRNFHFYMSADDPLEGDDYFESNMWQEIHDRMGNPRYHVVQIGSYWYSTGAFDDYSYLYNVHGSAPIAVGSFAPNAWGLYEMYGNVYEFCLDYNNTLQANHGYTDYVMPYDQNLTADVRDCHVRRGGHYGGSADWASASAWAYHKSDTASGAVGARLILKLRK